MYPGVEDLTGFFTEDEGCCCCCCCSLSYVKETAGGEGISPHHFTTTCWWPIHSTTDWSMRQVSHIISIVAQGMMIDLQFNACR